MGYSIKKLKTDIDSMLKNAKDLVLKKKSIKNIKLNKKDFPHFKINETSEVDLGGIYIIYGIKNKKFNIKELIKFSEKNKVKFIPKISEKMEAENYKENKKVCLYVGKSLNKLEYRINQHFINKAKNTYSLRLLEQPKKITAQFKSFEILYIPVPNKKEDNKTNYINLIENIIWDEEKPIFGKK